MEADQNSVWFEHEKVREQVSLMLFNNLVLLCWRKLRRGKKIQCDTSSHSAEADEKKDDFHSTGFTNFSLDATATLTTSLGSTTVTDYSTLGFSKIKLLAKCKAMSRKIVHNIQSHLANSSTRFEVSEMLLDYCITNTSKHGEHVNIDKINKKKAKMVTLLLTPPKQMRRRMTFTAQVSPISRSMLLLP